MATVQPTSERPIAAQPSVLETHTSILYFVGDRVVKVRKPVAFGFADFTDVRQRRRVCQREVELNRRLAPDVYFGTASIRMGKTVVEHAVVMRRLPADRSLAALVARRPDLDRQVEREVERVARLLARFHAGADRSPRVASQGTASAQWKRWAATAAELDRFVGDPIEPLVYRQTTELAHEYLTGRGELFGRRLADGAVCDGHGDLQAADVYCLDDGPRILDCLEFDDRLRYGDVLADVAFLALDLERLGAPAAAEHLLARYREESGRNQPPSLLHFYLAARAQVRLLVECIRAEQGLGTSSSETVATALSLLARHLQAARVRVVLVGGAPGSGKSTLTASLAAALGWEIVSTDHLRRGITATMPVEQRYGAAERSSVYHAVIAQAEELARDGRSVLLDATWSDAAQRARAADMARRASAQFLELRCDCPLEIATARIAGRRAAEAGESEATPDVAARLAALVVPWPGALSVPTGGTAAAARGAALAQLAANGVRPYQPLVGSLGMARPPAEGTVTGHRLLVRTDGRQLEAWGPDRATCLTEALAALVESFAHVADAASTRILPLAAAPGDEDAVISLLEDVLSAVDVFGVVPVRFHLAETENGGVAGDMEVVPADEVELVGPVPKGASYHGLTVAAGKGGWRCRVAVDL